MVSPLPVSLPPMRTPAPAPAPDPDPARRLALGTFLRAHRERLDPARAGISVTRRRRTPGLRREEVAARAGVSVAWYTWLEQGRDVHPSREAMAFIAAALALDPPAREHLFTLAGHGAVPPADLAAAAPVPPGIRPVLDALDPHPAYVNDLCWSVLAWNRAADAVFGWSALAPEDRNSLLLMFTSRALRARMVDWEAVATSMVATFRMNVGSSLGDPGVAALLARLGASQDFTRLWQRHDVGVRRAGRKAMRHPTLGDLVFDHQAFQILDAPTLRLVVYTPVGESTGRACASAAPKPDR
jgi:transcriptional regulator with XRE-family HTH domain